ncbi:MAG: DHH family phosphoesterase [Candidatus Berkelbacteria bacterium]|nr:DHH family phosphoesterase [Candidatus Berkelbacteria bacterium]
MQIKKEKIIITGYENPDLDNIASAYAYKEYLDKKGIKTEIGIFGPPHPEAQFLMDYLGIRLKRISRIYDPKAKIILVDCSEPGWIYPKIKKTQVIEVYDHRTIHQVEVFKNAKKQIDPTGACATIIAEKFYKKKMKPSRIASILMYCVIISHTINFKARVTTKRDKKMANWLKNQIRIPKNLIHQMFAHKSAIKGPLKNIFHKDFAVIEFGGIRFSIFQLEIINVKKLINERLAEAKKALLEIKKESKFDLVFLTSVDIEKGYNTFVAPDEMAEEAINTTLGVKFENGVAIMPHVIMRKEIMPLLKEYLEKIK